MDDRKVLLEVCRKLIGVIFVAAAVGWGMQQLPNKNVFIDFCTILSILESAAGIFVAISLFKNRYNGKALAIAIGYCTIAILTAVVFYQNHLLNKQSNNQYEFLMRMSIDILEIVYIIAPQRYVHTNAQVKRFIFISIGLFILSLTLGCNKYLHSILTLNVIQIQFMNSCTHILLLAIVNIFFIVYYLKGEEIHKQNRDKMMLILVLYSIYEASIMIFQMASFTQGECFLALLKLSIYTSLVSMIFNDTFYFYFKEAEGNLIDKTKKLTDDMEQKSRLVMVSQRLQTDVDQIMLTVQRLSDTMQKPEYLNKIKFLTMIKQNGSRLKRLAYNIGAMHQLENGEVLPQFRVVNIASFLNQMIESVESYTHAMHTQIQFIQSKTDIYCRIDPDLFERTMLNLISNAVKYNKENGLVTVYVNSKRNDIYICIKDTGVGISTKKIHTIFNKFERGDNETAKRREGSGLGLSIVKSLIEIHKGSISIVSKEHYGTTVSIKLPKYQGAGYGYEQYRLADKRKLEDKIKIEFSNLGV